MNKQQTHDTSNEIKPLTTTSRKVGMNKQQTHGTSNEIKPLITTSRKVGMNKQQIDHTFNEVGETSRDGQLALVSCQWVQKPLMSKAPQTNVVTRKKKGSDSLSLHMPKRPAFRMTVAEDLIDDNDEDGNKNDLPIPSNPTYSGMNLEAPARPSFKLIDPEVSSDDNISVLSIPSTSAASTVTPNIDNGFRDNAGIKVCERIRFEATLTISSSATTNSANEPQSSTAATISKASKPSLFSFVESSYSGISYCPIIPSISPVLVPIDSATGCSTKPIFDYSTVSSATTFSSTAPIFFERSEMETGSFDSAIPSSASTNSEIDEMIIVDEPASTPVNSEVEEMMIVDEPASTPVNSEVDEMMIVDEPTSIPVNSEIDEMVIVDEPVSTPVNSEIDEMVIVDEPASTPVNSEIDEMVIVDEPASIPVNSEIEDNTVEMETEINANNNSLETEMEIEATNLIETETNSSSDPVELSDPIVSFGNTSSEVSEDTDDEHIFSTVAQSDPVERSFEPDTPELPPWPENPTTLRTEWGSW